MKGLPGRLARWLDERTAIPTGVRHFLYEEIPASSGWRQVFGSVALFLFLVQAFTGALLAFNYAPTPGEAYNSVRYVVTEVTGGRLIRGLHHWGASVLIVVVVLHMAQVFLAGAYRKPRETTWLAGVVLLLLTLAFGLTGYLLPWDNRAYWGTVVVTQIGAQMPIVGQYISRFLGGESAVGVVTFARFYAMHALLLPVATLLMIGMHVYLVRKHGVAPRPDDEILPKKRFYPAQAFKDSVAVFIAFAVLFTLAAAAHAPLEKLADPSDTNYVPRPEWYFLFLFQLLKLFTGPLEVVGTVVLPAAALLVLFLAPFVDRGRMARVRRRTVAIGALILAGLGWAGLTAAAVMSVPRQKTAAEEPGGASQSAPVAWTALSPEELAGIAYFREESCVSCHMPGGGGIGPDLMRGPTHKDARWMMRHFKNPGALRPGSAMPPIQLNDAQLHSLTAFLLKLRPENAAALQQTPDFAAKGAAVYESNHCSDCHMVNRIGMNAGPPLNGLAARRERVWVEQHFLNPQKYSPGSIMPPFRLSPADLGNLTSYLLALPQ